MICVVVYQIIMDVYVVRFYERMYIYIYSVCILYKYTYAYELIVHVVHDHLWKLMIVYSLWNAYGFFY